ncbi:MAG: hypothetical protein WC028_16980 [Candidatus Obscuribacterales bacterium]
MMRNTLSNHLKLMLLLLAIGLADSPAIAEPEPRRLLDKDHLKGDFGPHPYPPGAGRPREAWETDPSKLGPVHNWPQIPNGYVEPSPEIRKNMMRTFGPYERKTPSAQWSPNQGPSVQNGQLHKRTGPPKEREIATDINHLQKTKDGRWLFNSIEDEKLFFLLPKEKVVPLLGVPRKNTGGLVQYNCRVKDSTGYLELFIGDEFVQSSRIRLEDKFAPSKGRK